mgnify:CR=1 FL=1
MHIENLGRRVIVALILVGFIGYVLIYPNQAANTVNSFFGWAEGVGEDLVRGLADFTRALLNN